MAYHICAWAIIKQNSKFFQHHHIVCYFFTKYKVFLPDSLIFTLHSVFTLQKTYTWHKQPDGGSFR